MKKVIISLLILFFLVSMCCADERIMTRDVSTGKTKATLDTKAELEAVITDVNYFLTTNNIPTISIATFDEDADYTLFIDATDDTMKKCLIDKLRVIGDGTDQDYTILTVNRASTDAKMEWDETNDEFDFNYPINVGGASNTLLFGNGESIDNADNGILSFDKDGTPMAIMKDTALEVAGGIDAIGAVDMDYGSGDVTDHTFTTDGTGTAEIVLPAGSIDGTEILDDTVDSADYAADSIDNEHINWADITNLDNAGAIIVADTSDTTSFVALWESATGSLAAKSDAGITYNAGTANLATTTFTGALTGNADTVTTITGLAPDTQNIYTRTQYLIPYASTTTAFTGIAIGTDGQILTSGGAGVAPSFEDAPASGAFTLDTAVIRENVSGAGDYATDDFVIGSPQLADDGDSAHDYRMWFDKSKGAFRAGRVESTTWDDGSVGAESIALGYNTTASGERSFAVGSYSSATNGYAIAMGNGSASGQYSMAIGNSVASASYAVALSNRSSAYLIGQLSSSGGWFAANGDAQYSRVVCRADTTDGSAEVMYIDNSSKLIIPADRVWRIDGNVIATTENSAATATWAFQGVLRRDASNNTTLDWSNVTEDYDGITTDAAVTLSADDTNEALNINITGKNATNIRWVATVNLTEVGY